MPRSVVSIPTSRLGMPPHLSFPDSREVVMNPCADWLRSMAVKMASRLGVKCWAVGHRPPRGRLGILLYHRLAHPNPSCPAPTNHVTPEVFGQQIRGLLAAGFVFWPLRRILEHRTRGWCIPPYVTALTFDDGYGGVYAYAWPLLRELQVPATLFINTAYLDSPEPLPFDHWGVANSDRAEPIAYRPLTTQECREMVASGLIDLGSHTHSHRDFRGHAAELEADIRASQTILRELTGQEHFSFAYPYGNLERGFLADDQVEAARRSGVLCGLHSSNALVRPGQDPWRWGRLRVYSWDNGESLAAKLTGWYARRPCLMPPRCRPDSRRRTLDFSRSASPTARSPESPTPPRISVVVPTYNRADWLSDALRSLVEQEPNGEFVHEIIVVDNASTDHTAEVVQRWNGPANPPIRYLRQEQPGDAPTRNAGCRVATGEWLAFFDDDQTAPSHWLRELLATAQRVDGAIVGGPVCLDLTEQQRVRLGRLGRRALREIDHYDRVQPYVGNLLPGTGNALVARWVFDRIGYFDESMRSGGSDTDFFTRARFAGIPLWYTPGAEIRHRIAEHRVTDDFLRWDAMIGGASQAAHFDLKERGRRGVMLVCLTRVAQAVGWNFPNLVVAWWRGDEAEVLGRRLLLWRAQGYLRQTLFLLAPRCFPQHRFFRWLDFRNSRVVGIREERRS